MHAERQPTGASALSPPPSAIADASLFFDFDGTLVDLAATPDTVIVGQALLDRIDALAEAMPGRIAIVSGRSIAQLDALIGPKALTIAIAGSHGAERRTSDEGHVVPSVPAAMAVASAILRTFAERNGVVFEAKSLGAALHYRIAPDREAAATRLAETVAMDHGLVLQRGKMMIEVRSPGDKGAGVRALMASPAMAGTRPHVFGDDVTDEDGFAAAAMLGGAGVLIGEERMTAALYRIPDVAGLHTWIDSFLETRCPT